MKRVRTPALELAYEETGQDTALPVVLLHGYPYDPRAFDEVAKILAGEGLRVIVPYLRGYGATRILDPRPMRSGEQAAIGQDLLDLLEALRLERALLAGFDWGARAACIVAALWPERVHGLVTCAGYQIQDIAAAAKPVDPEQEWRFWYQYYFHTERGRSGLAANRAEIGLLLWSLWSPRWAFDAATYRRTAASFDNEDFVDVVIHSYRHRMGNARGDPRHAALQARLDGLPRIGVPAIVLHGAVDGVNPVPSSEGHQRFFTGPYERRVLPEIGHNPPQEAPRDFADAVLALCR